jgi:hypothetical protein
VRGLFPYKQTAGGSTTRRLIGAFDDATDEWELHYSNDSGATWTFLYDAGAGSVGQIPDFAQFGDDLYITNGKVVPRKLSDTTIAAAGATQSPTPTAAASASAGLLLGSYKYKLVSMVSGSGRPDRRRVDALAVQDKQITLSWTADSNVSVTGYEVYRTSGTGDVFYFVDYVDLRASTSYTDNTADLTILENRVLEEHGDRAADRLLLRTAQTAHVVVPDGHVSDARLLFRPGEPASVLTTANFLDFSDSETVGDVLTGAIGNFEGSLVVFTERALWTVSGTGQVIGNVIDWTRTRTNAQAGSVSHRTAARVPAGSKYTDQNGKTQVTNVVTIAYLTPLNDVRLFDGDNDVIISHPMRRPRSPR